MKKLITALVLALTMMLASPMPATAAGTETRRVCKLTDNERQKFCVQVTYQDGGNIWYIRHHRVYTPAALSNYQGMYDIDSLRFQHATDEKRHAHHPDGTFFWEWNDGHDTSFHQGEVVVDFDIRWNNWFDEHMEIRVYFPYDAGY